MTSMTCTECLSLVATADVSDLTTSAAVQQHCRGCAECARVIEEVAEEERRLRDTLDEIAPGVPPGVVALRAVADAARQRRRRASRRGVGAVVGALVVAMGAVFFTRAVVPAPAHATAGTSVLLRCLGVDQALQLTMRDLPPGVREVVTVSARRDEYIPMLRISGPPDAVAATERVIKEVEQKYGPLYSRVCAFEQDAAKAAPGGSGSNVPAASAPQGGAVPADVYRPERGR